MTKYTLAAVAAGLMAVGGCGDDGDKTKTEPADTSVEITTKQVVRATTPGKKPTSKQKRPTSTATVSKGDVVALVTQVPKQDLPAGAVLRIDVAKGPGSTLTTSAGGLEGTRSKGTIRAKSGSVSLTKLRYGCAVAPQPTFCPVTVKQTDSGWEFRMSPGKTPQPVVINMVVG